MQSFRSRPLFVLASLLCASLAAANVDVLSSGGSIYVGWSRGQESYIEIHGGQQERSFGFPMVSIGVNDPPENNLVVVVSDEEQGVADSAYILDPSSLETIMSREITAEDLIGYPSDADTYLKVARHNDSDSDIFVSAMGLGIVPYERHMISARLVPDPPGIAIDSLHGRQHNNYPYSYTCLSRPCFSIQSVNPSLYFVEIYSWHTDQYSVFSAVHQPPLTDYDRIDHTLIYTSYGSYMDFGTIRAVGSCSSEILLLWTRENGLGTYYSTFDGLSPDTLLTDPLPFELPEDLPCAMSCDSDDSGLLFVWHAQEELLCRYYEGEWNQHRYLVQDSVYNVGIENLSVCSDTEGYWIAWLEPGLTSPEVVFVPRDSVTAVGEEASRPVQPTVRVRARRNPTRGPIYLTLEAEKGPLEVLLFDLAGRLVHTGRSSGPGAYVCDEVLQPGVYMVVASAGRESSSCRVVLLD